MTLFDQIKALPAMARSRHRILREGAWVTVGQVTAAVGLVAGTRLITEFVSPETYGTASLLLGIAILAKNIFCTPVLSAVLRFYPEAARANEVWRLRGIIQRMLRWTTAALLIALLSAGASYAWWQNISAMPFILLGIVLVFDVAQSMEVHLWLAARRQRAVSVSIASDALLRPMLIVAAAVVLGATAGSVILGYAVSYAVIFGGSVLLASREGAVRPADAGQAPDHPSSSRADLVRRILRYAIPLMPLALMSWITSLSDRYIVGAKLTLEEVGVYAAAFSLMSHPFLIAYGTVSRTLTPVYNTAVSHGSHQHAARIFRTWLLLTVLIGIMGLACTWVLRYWVAHWLLAAKYRNSVDLMPWIALGYCIYAVAWVFEKKLYARKQTVRLAIIHTMVAATAVAAPLVLIQYFGLTGVAMACPVHFGVMAALMVAMCGRDPKPGGLPAPNEAIGPDDDSVEDVSVTPSADSRVDDARLVR